jgi:hypothetical protein
MDNQGQSLGLETIVATILLGDAGALQNSALCDLAACFINPALSLAIPHSRVEQHICLPGSPRPPLFPNSISYY